MNTEALETARDRYLNILLSKAEAKDGLDAALLDRIERLLDVPVPSTNGHTAESNIGGRNSTDDVAMRSRSRIPVSLVQKKVQKTTTEIDDGEPKDFVDEVKYTPPPIVGRGRPRAGETIAKICRGCKREFLTTSKTKVLCDACFYDESAAARDLRAERPKPRGDRSEKRFIMEGVTHGSAHSYRKGCRCWPCTDAKGADMREYEARRAARA